MAEIVISPATADRFDDAEHALSGGGDGQSCQCQWWTITNAEFQRASLDERRALLRDEVENAAPPPALIAYVDGEAAGWVRVGPRTAQVRIAPHARHRREHRRAPRRPRRVGGHVLRRAPRASRHEDLTTQPARRGRRLRPRATARDWSRRTRSTRRWARRARTSSTTASFRSSKPPGSVRSRGPSPTGRSSRSSCDAQQSQIVRTGSALSPRLAASVSSTTTIATSSSAETTYSPDRQQPARGDQDRAAARRRPTPAATASAAAGSPTRSARTARSGA